MPKTKKDLFGHPVISLLKSFSEEEIFGFNDFLNSAYYNTNKKIVDLYNALIIFYPEFQNEELSREYLWSSMNSKKNISYDELRVYLSMLQSLMMEFLKVNYFSKHSFEGELAILKELSMRNQIDLFRKRLQKIQDSEDLNREGNDVYIKKYSLDSESLNFSDKNFQTIKTKDIKTEVDAINNIAISLSNYYVTDLILAYIKSYNFIKKFQNEIKNSLMSDLVDSLNLGRLIKTYKKHSQDYLILEIYEKLLQLFNDDGIENYYEYKDLVNENIDKINNDELYFHYSNMISYCIHEKMKSSRELTETFKDELFNLYQKFLEHKVFIINETMYMDLDIFRNILMNALSLKKIDWAEKFIDEYIKHINPNYQINLLNYSKAILFNRRGSFKESLEYAVKVDINNFIYKHDLNFLKLRNYYSTGDFDGLMHLIHSHRELLRIDKLLPKDFYNRYMTFLAYLEKLVKYDNSPKKLDFYLHKLEKEKLPHKNWLIEKYKEKLKI